MAGLYNFIHSFTSDLARPNRFEVFLNLPPSISQAASGSFGINPEELRYRCEVAQLPGRTLDTVEQKTYGPIEKFPNLTTYTDIDLTFIVDDYMNVKEVFDLWLEFINYKGNNNFYYKSEYAADIKIAQYTVANELAYSVRLIDAFPISMNQMDLDWSSDGYHKLNVTFAYTYWDRVY